MKISDIQINDGLTLELVPAVLGEVFPDGKAWVNRPVNLFEAHGDPYLKVGQDSFEVQGASPKDKNGIQDLLREVNRSLIYVSRQSPNSLNIEARIFPNAFSPGEKFEFGLGGIIEDDLRKNFEWAKGSLGQIIEALKKMVFIPIAENGTAVVITQGAATEKLGNAYRILGKGIALDIQQNDKGQLEIRKVTRAGALRRESKNPIFLLKGDFDIQDITHTGIDRSHAVQTLNAITNSGESYIRLWEEYNQLEKEDALRKVKDLGAIAYSKVEYDASKSCFRFFSNEDTMGIQEWLKRLSKHRLSIEIVSSFPEILRGGDLDSDNGKDRRIICEFEEQNKLDGSLFLRQKNEDTPSPPTKGYLFGSMLGDIIRLKRREKAAELIRTAEGAMPNISLILEERPVNIRNARRIQAITPALSRKLPFRLNEKQEQALDMALNTPDVALIQGPPGTGKTQVISAICERLAEVAKENNLDPSKMVALTAFQHDAVGNAADRTSVLGLPAIKVGKQSESINPIDSWRNETQEKVRIELDNWPEGTINSLKKEVWKSFAFITQSQPKEDLVTVELEKIRDMLRGTLPVELFNRLTDLIFTYKGESIGGVGATDSERLLKSIRAIRTEKASWEDDGPLKLNMALTLLKKANFPIPEESSKIVKELLLIDLPSPDQFIMLDQFKSDLLDKMSMQGEAQLPLRDLGVVKDIFQNIHQALTRKMLHSKEGIQAALEDYLEDLEEDPESIRETIEAYTTILAATVQGLDSKKIHDLKATGRPDFDTVIIDEAARANPLDLFIALTKGRRRIILVGDHRQLPHLLEPKVEEELAAKSSAKLGPEAFEEAMQKSLFERLFIHLRKQEEIDGYKRTITLDQQYRMHPVIGDFVSETFYEAHHDTRIISKTDAGKLIHGIQKFESKQVAWVEVPHHIGGEYAGQSKSRKIEAKILAAELKKAMDERPDLSFGVITFYQDQVEELFNECSVNGIKLTEKDDKGDWKINRLYRELEKDNGAIEERLRIGSVDAFQGKEFDVVFLSVVRSNDFPLDPAKPETVRRKYGFLTLENRINVAMSRARRLLVGFGNSSMFNSPEAKKVIPGMHAFYQITGGEYGIRI